MTAAPTDDLRPADATPGAAADATLDVAPDSDDAPARPVSDELPLAGRKALVTLMTHRFISRATQKEAWAGLLAHEPEVRARLAEMFLELEVDRGYEVAFKRQVGGDDAPVLLRREKPLSRDASFLLIFLRREHAYADGDDDAVVVSRDQVAEFLGRFHDDTAHDEVRALRRVDAAIAAMVARDLLEPEPDDPSLFVVAPAIVPLVRPEQLRHFERVYLEAAGAEPEAGAPAASAAAPGELDEPDELTDPDPDPELDAGDDLTELDPDAAHDAGDTPAPDDAPRASDTALDLPLDLPLDPEADQA
ncbi:hypothetical protein ASF82_07410 [Frigoribacterium sp. Leaf164]|uniref:DUF4194 domain-containing protein n=1 Tax=Frigoribacterium sp. Leaf164 TaxID=1736282 RepID=UPI0006F4C052|nr:DUF4194 domain-containing protein [Frigoribacterium sp. Leaf164]KQR47148.1 hypothetical protein ASF82_07410 [Frigoribacterium sp. Leaf164]